MNSETVSKGGKWQTFREFAMFLALGMSGWWSANALLAELPTFVDRTKEGKKIANLMSVAVQVGNIFPVTYKLICACLGEKTQRRILPFTVFTILVLAMGALAFAAVTWGLTLPIFGADHSVFLLIVTAVCGGVGGMSNVTYWALASRYDDHCIKAVSTGMTVGGLFAAGLAIIQGAGEHPRFAAEWYLVVAASIQLLMTGIMIPIFRLKSTEEECDDNNHGDQSPLLDCDDLAEKEEAKIGSKVRAPRGTDAIANTQSKSNEKSPLLINAEVEVNDTELKREANARVIRGRLLIAICFLLYGMTYALPSLIPYLIQNYEIFAVNSTTHNVTTDNGFESYLDEPPYEDSNLQTLQFPIVSSMEYTGYIGSTYLVTNTTKGSKKLKDNIYLAITVMQNVGDVGGRLSTVVFTPKKLSSLLVLSVAAMVVFTALSLGTIWNNVVPWLLPHKYGYVISVVCLVYYYLRGLLVTSVYLWVKRAFPKFEAEQLSSNLGMAGQIGALFSNMLMFYVVQENLIGAPGKSP